jgi:Rod binding domain-containing protein
MTINPMSQAAAAIHGHGTGKDKNAQIESAAKQFESVLLTQLMQVMWKGSPGMSKGAGAMYQSMMQTTMADHLAESGGIGLAKMISQALGGAESTGAGSTRHAGGEPRLIGPHALPLQPSAAKHGSLMEGISAAASGMVGEGVAARWAKGGALTAGDLSASAGDRAQSLVNGAHGYQGYYK